MASLDNQNGGRHNQARIHKHCTEAADTAVVGNQPVRVQDNPPDTLRDAHRGVKKECEQNH